jgi:hypothetical protein
MILDAWQPDQEISERRLLRWFVDGNYPQFMAEYTGAIGTEEIGCGPETEDFATRNFGRGTQNPLACTVKSFTDIYFRPEYFVLHEDSWIQTTLGTFYAPRKIGVHRDVPVYPFDWKNITFGASGNLDTTFRVIGNCDVTVSFFLGSELRAKAGSQRQFGLTKPELMLATVYPALFCSVTLKYPPGDVSGTEVYLRTDYPETGNYERIGDVLVCREIIPLGEGKDERGVTLPLYKEKYFPACSQGDNFSVNVHLVIDYIPWKLTPTQSEALDGLEFGHTGNF